MSFIYVCIYFGITIKRNIFFRLPQWLKSNEGSVVDTTKLWRRRFFHTDALAPQWLRWFLVYIPKSQWDAEDKDMQLFKKHSMTAFGKHLRQPNKHFNNFKSFETEETLESDLSSKE